MTDFKLGLADFFDNPCYLIILITRLFRAWSLLLFNLNRFRRSNRSTQRAYHIHDFTPDQREATEISLQSSLHLNSSLLGADPQAQQQNNVQDFVRDRLPHQAAIGELDFFARVQANARQNDSVQDMAEIVHEELYFQASAEITDHDDASDQWGLEARCQAVSARRNRIRDVDEVLEHDHLVAISAGDSSQRLQDQVSESIALDRPHAAQRVRFGQRQRWAIAI